MSVRLKLKEMCSTRFLKWFKFEICSRQSWRWLDSPWGKPIIRIVKWNILASYFWHGFYWSFLYCTKPISIIPEVCSIMNSQIRITYTSQIAFWQEKEKSDDFHTPFWSTRKIMNSRDWHSTQSRTILI